VEIISKPVDFNKVRRVVYHLPNGPSFSVEIQGAGDLIEFGFGDTCDTSEIDGVLHFFPKGNA
jgi:hypothetical protein